MLVLCTRNTNLALNCSRIQCQDYRKRNKETDAMAVRSRQTYTHASKKNRTGDILDWKTNQPQNMSRIISDNFVVVVVVFSHIFICSKFRHIKYTQIIYSKWV